MALFPTSRTRIRREASDWVVRLSRQPGPEDHAAFTRWRDADPRHAAAYDRIAAIWHGAGQLSRRPANRGLQANSGRRPRTVGLALAASLVAAMFATSLLLGTRWLTRSGAEQQRILFDAAVGEISAYDLPDGSRLTLDSASRVEAVFTKSQRNLMLRSGRARFRVRHEGRPFVVQAGGSEVVATGTLFDVSLIGGHTTVLLLEGSVEVRAKDERRRPDRLGPGQKLFVAASGPAERRPVSRGEAAWPARLLQFEDTRLDDAVAMANRYSKVQLRLGDDRIRGLRVSGAYRAGDVAGFARGLGAAFGLRVVRQPDGSLMLVDAAPGGRAAGP